jgi:hypothetical protein
VLSEYRYGALYVIRENSDDALRRELKRIDDRLFFEKQITYTDEEVWCVCVDFSGDQPPMTILEWRDEKGRPIPYLDSGIIERVKQVDRSGRQLSERVLRENQARIESLRRQSREQYTEVARDMVPRVLDQRRPVLHRSQALRMSRDKRRARGEKA